MEYTKKEKALYRFLDIWEEGAVKENGEVYEVDGGREYLVLTDEEADQKTREYIEETVWAFNSDFIISHSEILDYDDASEKIISSIQAECENGNEAIKKLIDDMEEFVEDAISADGRGHFLSSYDGEENEQEVNGEIFYIYRTN